VNKEAADEVRLKSKPQKKKNPQIAVQILLHDHAASSLGRNLVK
jgi:hypothetical protein